MFFYEKNASANSFSCTEEFSFRFEEDELYFFFNNSINKPNVLKPHTNANVLNNLIDVHQVAIELLFINYI